MIEIAGGEDVAGPPGRSRPQVEWEDLRGLDPDVVVSMPCGWYLEESCAQALQHRDRLGAFGAARVYAVDGASTFSRPGPRLVDGVELLGHLFHPELVQPPDGDRLRRADGSDLALVEEHRGAVGSAFAVGEAHALVEGAGGGVGLARVEVDARRRRARGRIAITASIRARPIPWPRSAGTT